MVLRSQVPLFPLRFVPIIILQNYNVKWRNGLSPVSPRHLTIEIPNRLLEWKNGKYMRTPYNDNFMFNTRFEATTIISVQYNVIVLL